MDIFLNRRGGVPVRDQIVTQLELRILDGTLPPGSRLPSVRALARRLDVHANTVSAAYQDLQKAGSVRLRRGSGVFVRPAAPVTLPEARGLDEMIRLALYAAFHKGYSGAEIRSAVERWLAASPPDRIVVVDPALEMAELIAREVGDALGLPMSARSLDDVTRDASLLSGALTLCLPYHLETISRLAPGVALEALNIEMSAQDRDAILALPAGSVVLLVTHSPTVIPFASVILRTLRGDEILGEARLLAATREWRRLLPAADVVLADALSVEAVRRARPRRLREVRVVTEVSLSRLRQALSVVAPRIEAETGKRPGRQA
jgi:DNA-binding transcriptional regulator YhcF (GntR family)